MLFYRFVSAYVILKKRASPRSWCLLRSSQTFGGTARRDNASRNFRGLQTRYRREQLLIMGMYHFAESEKSVNRKNAPWFRVNFVRYEQNFNSGRRKKFLFISELTKADKSCKDFCLFLQLFLSKRKSWSYLKGRKRFANPKNNKRGWREPSPFFY